MANQPKEEKWGGKGLEGFPITRFPVAEMSTVSQDQKRKAVYFNQTVQMGTEEFSYMIKAIAHDF